MFIKSLKSIFRQSDWSVFVTHHLHENNKGKGHCDFHGNAGVYSITENGDWIKVIKHALPKYIQTFNRAVIQLL